MRVLLVLLMVLGTSTMFAKGRSHRDKVVKVESKHSGNSRHQRGQYRRGRHHRKYYRYPKRIVRYEPRRRIHYWPRFSVIFDL